MHEWSRRRRESGSIGLVKWINRDAARDENGGGLWWAKGEGG